MIVWHVKELIKNVFRLDASLDLGALNLEPPPPDWRDPDDPPPGGAGGGVGGGAGSSSPASSQKPSGSDQQMGNGDHTDSNNFNPDEGGFRQHTTTTTTDPLEISNDDGQGNGTSSNQVHDDDDDIVELEVPRVPTPDIVDLIDSDDEEADNNGGHYVDNYEGGASVVTDNAEDDTELQPGGPIHVTESPKIITRPTDAEVNDESDYEMEIANKNPSPRKSSSLLKRRGKKRKSAASGNQNPKNANAAVVDSPQRIFLPVKPTDIKTESPLPVAQVMPFQSSPNYQAVERPQIAPGMVVFRGKVVAKDEIPEKKPKPTALISGIYSWCYL